jgi:hypothetical protein
MHIIQESAESETRGMEYLQQAAEADHRAAMIELAKHLETGSSTVRYATNQLQNLPESATCHDFN